MTGIIILAVVLGLPLFLGVYFRVSTSHIFFSLMAGELLGRYFGHDIEHSTQPLLKEPEFSGYGEIALIILPMFLTALFLKNTTHKNRIFLHIIPLLITGIVSAAFILPVLPEFMQEEVRAVTLGEQLLDLNRTIVGVMITLQLISLWFITRKEKKRSREH